MKVTRLLGRTLCVRLSLSRLVPLAACVALVLGARTASAQFAPPQVGTQVKDASALVPPAGARVAIVEFADLECPACAGANPLMKEAAAKYKIPWVRHDFLIPSHTWSRQAAINARWFDTRSKALGDEYRDQVFANQTTIFNLLMLRQFTSQFAASHHIELPFSLDPDNRLSAAVDTDNELGKRTGIVQTPTVFIVMAHSKGAPFIEVTDRSKLFEMIDMALASTAPATRPAARKPASK